MVEAGLVVECGDREDEQGKAWTARRLADAVQDYFDPPREEQGDLWS
jgi:hypothetical protein